MFFHIKVCSFVAIKVCVTVNTEGASLAASKLINSLQIAFVFASTKADVSVVQLSLCPVVHLSRCPLCPLSTRSVVPKVRTPLSLTYQRESPFWHLSDPPTDWLTVRLNIGLNIKEQGIFLILQTLPSTDYRLKHQGTMYISVISDLTID